MGCQLGFERGDGSGTGCRGIVFAIAKSVAGIPEIMGTKDRDVWLDFIRALAIFSVVLCHMSSFYADTVGVPKTGIYGVFGLGGYGVDLFFVLSGWLLGGILLEEITKTGTLDLVHFYRKRWLRTLPCYYAVLIATLLQRAFSGKFNAVDLTYAGFLQTYTFSSMPFLTISWSLCVEEHFYLIIAPCLLFFRRSRNTTGIMLLVLITVPFLFRAFGFFNSTFQTHVRLDQCGFGVLLAFLKTLNTEVFCRYVNKLKWMVWFAVATLGLMFYCRYTGRNFLLEREWITPIAGIFVVQSVIPLSSGIDRFCRSGLIQYLASRSYCIYFCHVEALHLVRRLGWTDLISSVVLFLVVCLFLTEALHRIVERPCMAFGRRSSSRTNLVR
jgi:peptidoglycan/LPS O-acetylase OafA/YrhL